MIEYTIIKDAELKISEQNKTFHTYLSIKLTFDLRNS